MVIKYLVCTQWRLFRQRSRFGGGCVSVGSIVLLEQCRQHPGHVPGASYPSRTGCCHHHRWSDRHRHQASFWRGCLCSSSRSPSQSRWIKYSRWVETISDHFSKKYIVHFFKVVKIHHPFSDSFPIISVWTHSVGLTAFTFTTTVAYRIFGLYCASPPQKFFPAPQKFTVILVW